MSGEFEEIESVRKKRLQKEPDGFFLEDSEGGGYTCFICKKQDQVLKFGGHQMVLHVLIAEEILKKE